MVRSDPLCSIRERTERSPHISAHHYVRYSTTSVDIVAFVLLPFYFRKKALENILTLWYILLWSNEYI